MKSSEYDGDPFLKTILQVVSGVGTFCKVLWHLIRLWMIFVVVNALAPFWGDSSIGEVWYGPMNWFESVSRLCLAGIIAVGFYLTVWTLIICFKVHTVK